MTLYSYLKQFKNIAWYPSAYKDALPMACLSYKSLCEYGIGKDEVPDCYIYTDYETYADQTNDNRFFLDLGESENETEFNYPNSTYAATAFNIKELDRLNISFDRRMVDFDCDRYYGRVFVMDMLIEHPIIGKTIAKLVYVIAENTAFAFDFLLKKGIQVKFAIHSRYGHGFGGGVSNGGFMCNILKDLGTRYFASDITDRYGYDVADEYLSDIQRSTLPVLRKITNFSYQYDWRGYDDTIFYKISGFKQIEFNKENNRRFLEHEGEYTSD